MARKAKNTNKRSPPTKIETLRDPILQARILEAVRATGLIKAGAQVSGISQSTIERYREGDATFAQAMLSAQMYHRAKMEIKYNAGIKAKAFRQLLARLDAGKLSDAALMRIVYEFPDDEETPRHA